MPDSVTRYVVTHIGRNGLRTLTFGAQGRWTFATQEEAQARLDVLLSSNRGGKLTEVFGVSAFEVRPCACWPGHFDPKGIYFDE